MSQPRPRARSESGPPGFGDSWHGGGGGGGGGPLDDAPELETI
eukprot:gene21814-11035_t